MVHGDSSNSTSTDLRTPVLSFSITAMSQKDIDNVIKGIEEVGNETMKDMVLENEQYQKMIARLTEDQVSSYSQPNKIFFNSSRVCSREVRLLRTLDTNGATAMTIYLC